MATDEFLKIGISAEADVEGFRKTQEAAEETQRTVTEAATAPRTEQEQQAAAVKAVTDALREQAQAAAEVQSSAGAGQTGGSGAAGDAAANAQAAAAAERAAEANRKAARAAEEAAEAERMLRREMELASKTRLQLSQELGQLEKALRAAAKAGDTAAYQRLRGEMAEVKGAYEKVQSGCEMANVALTQQAQVGLQAGQTIASIGQAAAGGAGNVAGMASQVISLGAAFKAGLGPIGWAMAALQGLQVAWDYFTQRQEKARKAMEEARRAQEELNKTLLGAATAARGAIAEAWRDAAEEEVEAVERAGQQRLAVLEREQTAAQQRSEAMLERLRVETEATVQHAEARAAAGMMTAAELEDFRTAARERLREAEEKAAAEEDARAAERLRVEREVNEAVAAERQQLVNKLREEFGAHLTTEWSQQQEQRYAELKAQVEAHRAVAESETAVIDALNKQLEAEKAGADDEAVLAALREQRARAEARKAEAEAALREVDEQVEFEFKGLLDDARALSGARKATGMAALELARQTREVYEAELRKSEDAAAAVEAGKAAAAELQRTAELRAQQNGALAAAEESERAAQSVRDEVARQESDWAELQRGSLAEKRRWLEAEIAGMREGSERRLEYERRLQGVNEEIAAARVHELSSIEASRSYAVRDERSAQERMDADEQILIAKRETLRAELATGEHLTPVLRMNLGRQIAAVERQLEGLAQARLDEVSREAAEELRGIGAELRASRSYAGEVKRSEAEQLAADREILLAKRERLRALAGMPGLNEATLRGVNAALAETEREIDGLAARMAENAAAAGRWLREMEPPQLQARNSMLQRQLDALARGYAAAAKRAGEAAGRGDTQSLRQAERAAANYARNMNRLSKDSSAGTRLHERTRVELQKMVQAARSATRAQQQSNREAQRKSRADKQAADAAQKAAREARQRPAEAHAEGLQKFAEATARLEELERKVAEGIRNATAGVEKVSGATEGTLAAVEQLAGALAEMQQQTESRLKEIEKAISMLKKK